MWKTWKTISFHRMSAKSGLSQSSFALVSLWGGGKTHSELSCQRARPLETHARDT